MNLLKLSQAHDLIQTKSPLFIVCDHPIAASAFARSYADTFKDRYSHIYYLSYTGEFKTDLIIRKGPTDDPDDAAMDLFNKHYDVIRGFEKDSLVIVDGFFDQSPKDDPFFKEFIRNKARILITSNRPVEKYNQLILSPDECKSPESETFWQELSDEEQSLLRNLLLLPTYGIPEMGIRYFLSLPDSTSLEAMEKKKVLCIDDTNIPSSHGRQFYINPKYAVNFYDLAKPSVTNYSVLPHTLHLICLAPGLNKQKPVDTILAMIAVVRHVKNDNPMDYVLFLQDLFPYLDKYMIASFLGRLTDMISQLMEENKMDSPCDKALLLNYKAELFVMKRDLDNGLKKMQKAISIMEKEHTKDADNRTIHLLVNTYNNQSNLLMQMKKGPEAIRSLRNAFDIRLEYAALGHVDTRAMMQQIMNLISLLILNQDTKQAEEVLAIYENFVLQHAGEDSVDYAVSLLAQGIYTLSVGNPRVSEMNLLRAEGLLREQVGPHHEFTMTAYQYLSVLYDNWQRPELAKEYQDKLQEAIQNNSNH